MPGGADSPECIRGAGRTDDGLTRLVIPVQKVSLIDRCASNCCTSCWLARRLRSCTRSWSGRRAASDVAGCGPERGLGTTHSHRYRCRRASATRSRVSTLSIDDMGQRHVVARSASVRSTVASASRDRVTRSGLAREVATATSAAFTVSLIPDVPSSARACAGASSSRSTRCLMPRPGLRVVRGGPVAAATASDTVPGAPRTPSPPLWTTFGEGRFRPENVSYLPVRM